MPFLALILGIIATVLFLVASRPPAASWRLELYGWACVTVMLMLTFTGYGGSLVHK